MARRIAFPLSVVVALLLMVTPALGAPSAAGRYIVVLKDSVEHPAAVAARHRENRDAQVGSIYRSALKGYAAKLSPDAAKAIARDPQVAFVEPDHVVTVEAQTVPTGIQRTFAATNANLDIDSKDDNRVDVDVAVLDTGIDLEHPDLNVVGSTDCTTGGACVNGNGSDSHYHGTHVAGTIGALDNGVGVVGVAPGARLWGVRVLYGSSGLTSWVIAGVDWVTARAGTIEVANMSLGCQQCKSTALDEAIERSVDAGVVYAVAAGNSNLNVSEFSPADNPDVITVSALSDFDGLAGKLAKPACAETYPEMEKDVDDSLAWFSNWGSGIEVAAPGTCILSTIPTALGAPWNGYAYLSGTSMASPHVAGAAALLASKSNPANQKDVEAIRKTILEKGNSNWVDDSFDGTQEPLLDLSGFTATLRQPQWSPLWTPEPGGEYGGIACGQHDDCVAVGKSGHGSGFDGVLIKRWNGSSWFTEKTLSSDSELSDVSCPTTSACMAVGSILASGVRRGYGMQWNGSSWTGQLPPLPSGATSSKLTGVSCLSGSECVAVGSYVDSEGIRKTLAMSWNGSAWEIKTTSNPSGAKSSELTGVSCLSGSECVAVGIYTDSTGIVRKTLAMTWNGSSWEIKTTPNPSGAILSELYDVSCVSGSQCMAVGRHIGISAKGALVEKWNGSTWSVETAPSVAGSTSAELADVHCLSTLSKCVGAGSYRDSGNQVRPWIQSWNGSAWSEHTVEYKASGHNAVQFVGIACISFEECDAVGYFKPMGIANQFVAYGFYKSGNPWFPTDAGESELKLNAVSCVEANECMVVGELDSVAGKETMAQIWDGAKWTPTPEPAVAGPTRTLLGVGCVSIDFCIGVGRHFENYELVERWEGTSWYVDTQPGDKDAAMTGVSCISSTYCFIVGWRIESGNRTPRSRLWTGSWSNKTMPVPGGYTNVAYGDVSCLTTTNCIAVGSGTSSGVERALIARWNGTAWSSDTLPALSGATILQDISCISSSQCIAVGRYGSGATAVPLMLRWNGSSWSTQTAPAGIEYATLESVSCTAVRCVAAGHSYEKGLFGNRKNLTIEWNQTAWSVLPIGLDFEEVGDLACISATCTLVGSDYVVSPGGYEAKVGFYG